MLCMRTKMHAMYGALRSKSPINSTFAIMKVHARGRVDERTEGSYTAEISYALPEIRYQKSEIRYQKSRFSIF